jgi:hypothetical protein
MTTPSWMPPQPELPWVEGSLDGDLPPSAVKQWGYEYALAAVEAYRQTPDAKRVRAIAQAVEEMCKLRLVESDYILREIMRRADELDDQP